ncbi:aromatic ring-hydroxylating oxygenase subunit alpha [Rhodovibrionaceae bacterium A322]
MSVISSPTEAPTGMRNLAAAYYIDPDVYQRERNRIFWRSWQMLGPAQTVAEPRSYLTAEIAGAKVMVIRDRKGILRAFRNVCRHRGAPLLDEGSGSCSVLRCPYHNWVYDLDGSLRQAPWFGDDGAFDRADWPLEQVSVEIWRGLLFVAIDPDRPLKDQLADTIPELAEEPLESYTTVVEERLVFDANWKIYTDNFVEGYHIPGIHPEFFKAIEFEAFETTAHDNLVRMSAPPREGLFYKGKWLWMWPNWTLSLFDGGMNTSRINPLAHDRTELIYHFYFADGSADTAAQRGQTIESNLKVIREDFEICTGTQANYASGGYGSGPLSPRHEQGVAWFQSQYLAAVT